MSDEDKDNVEKILPDAEGKIPADKEGKYPELVPWSKYVGIKESLGGKLDSERAKVTSLEERLKGVISSEEHERVKGELEQTKANLQTITDELNTTKEKSLTEKRNTLIKRGMPEDKVKDMSDKELNAVLVAVEHIKPGADLGRGGGSSPLEGSPLELARRAYSGE